MNASPNPQRERNGKFKSRMGQRPPLCFMKTDRVYVKIDFCSWVV